MGPGDTPQFITGLVKVLSTISGWMLVIVPLAVVVTFAIGGFMLAKAEDGMEAKQIKEKMVKAIIGIGLAGSAMWIGNIWLTDVFITPPTTP
jgi:hypothetical protein